MHLDAQSVFERNKDQQSVKRSSYGSDVLGQQRKQMRCEAMEMQNSIHVKKRNSNVRLLQYLIYNGPLVVRLKCVECEKRNI